MKIVNQSPNYNLYKVLEYYHNNSNHYQLNKSICNQINQNLKSKIRLMYFVKNGFKNKWNHNKNNI